MHISHAGVAFFGVKRRTGKNGVISQVYDFNDFLLRQPKEMRSYNMDGISCAIHPDLMLFENFQEYITLVM